MPLKNSILLVLMLLGFSATLAQDVDLVIKRYIDFRGGEKQWKKIKTLITSGEYDYGGIKFPFMAYSKAPDRYKFIVPFNGKYYAQAFDGEKGWKIDAFKNETTPTLLSGKAALALANEADVELEDAFINYRAKGHSAAWEGTDTVSGKPCYKIRLTRKGGETERYYFDERTFALVMKQAVSKNPEMNGALLNTYYSDYRDAGGIRIPFSAKSESNGQPILTITVDKAVVNQPIEDKEFQPL